MKNDAGANRRRPVLGQFSLRRRNKCYEPKCCAVWTLCYISRIDAKCLEMANVQGIHKADVNAASAPQSAARRCTHSLPGICLFFTARSVAYVFMERIA